MLRVSTALFLAAVLGAVSSRGPLVLIGGGLEEDNEAIWGRMISEAGGEGVSDIDHMSLQLWKPLHISGCKDRNHHSGQL